MWRQQGSEFVLDLIIRADRPNRIPAQKTAGWFAAKGATHSLPVRVPEADIALYSASNAELRKSKSPEAGQPD
jgi:hypothetical protein